MHKIQYFSTTDRAELLDSFYPSSQYKLVEEQRHIDGNFLLFQQFNNITTIDQLTIKANSIDTITISNIPNPSTVTLGAFTDTVTDGEYQFTIDLPGTYTVTISSVPYLDKTFIITAT